MAKLPVRTAGERRLTPVEGEPLGTRWDPFRQVAPFLTGDDESARFKPDFKIERTEGGFLFKADLPGIKENEIDIAVSGNRLTISGHIYDSRACSFAGFTSAFTLPVGTDGSKRIHAALDRGVLTVLWSKRLEQAPGTATLSGDDPLARWESEGGISEEISAVQPGS
jgi:HSP20 family protein